MLYMTTKTKKFLSLQKHVSLKKKERTLLISQKAFLNIVSES